MAATQAESSPRVSTSLLTNFHAFRLYSFQKRGRPSRSGIQVIATLDPNKFAEKGQQRLHIGNLMYYGTHISLLKTSSPVKAKHLEYDMVPKCSMMHLPFPPGTKAFLYYFTPPEKPPSRQNCVSELHQVIIMRLSRVGRTSC